MIWVEAVLFFGGLTRGNGIVFVDEATEVKRFSVYHDDGPPFFMAFVPVDTSMTGSICDVEFLVEAVGSVSDVANVFDSVVTTVLVFVVNNLRRPLSVYDEPNDSVSFVSFAVDADS